TTGRDTGASVAPWRTHDPHRTQQDYDFDPPTASKPRRLPRGFDLPRGEAIVSQANPTTPTVVGRRARGTRCRSSSGACVAVAAPGGTIAVQTSRYAPVDP